MPSGGARELESHDPQVEQLEEEQPEHPPPAPAIGVVMPPALLDTDENADTLRFEGFRHSGQATASADLEIGRISSN